MVGEPKLTKPKLWNNQQKGGLTMAIYGQNLHDFLKQWDVSNKQCVYIMRFIVINNVEETRKI